MLQGFGDSMQYRKGKAASGSSIRSSLSSDNDSKDSGKHQQQVKLGKTSFIVSLVAMAAFVGINIGLGIAALLSPSGSSLVIDESAAHNVRLIDTQQLQFIKENYLPNKRVMGQNDFRKKGELINQQKTITHHQQQHHYGNYLPAQDIFLLNERIGNVTRICGGNYAVDMNDDVVAR